MDRAKRIGGSEIAAIAGVSPYQTPLDVYLRKLKLTEVPQTPAMRIGQLLEHPILTLYQETLGVSCQKADHPLVHAAMDWMIGSPDAYGWYPHNLLSRWGIEIKTAGVRQAHRWGEPESDDIPQEYRCQVAWYQAITGYDRWDLAVLIGGNDFRIYTLTRDESLEALLMDAGEQFLQEYLLPEIPPPLDGSPSAHDYLAHKYPSASDEMIPADARAILLLQHYASVKTMLDSAEQDLEETKVQLKAIIGEKRGVQGGNYRATWALSKDSHVTDWKGVAQTFNPPDLIIANHTSRKPGSRRFLFTEKGQ